MNYSINPTSQIWQNVWSHPNFCSKMKFSPQLCSKMNSKIQGRPRLTSLFSHFLCIASTWRSIEKISLLHDESWLKRFKNASKTSRKLRLCKNARAHECLSLGASTSRYWFGCFASAEGVDEEKSRLPRCFFKKITKNCSGFPQSRKNRKPCPRPWTWELGSFLVP